MSGPLTQSNYQPESTTDVWRKLPVETYEIDGHKLHRMGGLVTIKAGRFGSLEANIQPEDYPRPDHDRQRLVVALGMGTDSVAMLIAMRDRGIRPDVVQWADTGSERVHTYRYVRRIQNWLKHNGFPPLLVVRLVCPQAGHRSLFEQLWNTEQLPSPAFRQNHSCSAKWKLAPQRNYHRFLRWLDDGEARTAIGFSAEETNRKIHGVAEAVGFSEDEKSRRSYQVKDGDGYVTWYPLQEWKITRQDCVDLIRREKIPQPGKSACFFCPMNRKCELRAMAKPELEAAIAMEQRARDGGKLQTDLGLRGLNNPTWAEWMETEDTPAEKVYSIGLVSDLS